MPDNISLTPVDYDPFAGQSDEDFYNASVKAGQKAQAGGVPLTIQKGESSGSVAGPNQEGAENGTAYLPVQPSSEYATMKPYEPTLREKLTALLAGTDTERPSPERARVAEGLSNIVGLTPAGIPMAAQEARQEAGQGNYIQAGLSAMAMMPAGGVAGKVAAAASPYVRTLNDIGLYSHAAETAAGLPQLTGTPEQFKAMLLKGGVKPAEIEAAGYDAATSGLGKVSRDDVVMLFEGAVPQLEEKVLGNVDPNARQYFVFDEDRAKQQGPFPTLDAALAAKQQNNWTGNVTAKPITENPTKFSSYTLPGGSNYREVLLKAPTQQNYGVKQAEGMYRLFDYKNNDWVKGLDGKLIPGYETEQAAKQAAEGRNATSGLNPMGNFTSSHWDDPNVVAHLRMSDRYAPNPNPGFRVVNKRSGNAGPTFDTEQEAINDMMRYPESIRKDLRFDSVAKNPEKVLHLEELQSDWGQAGRKKGFVNDPIAMKQLEGLRQQKEQALSELHNVENRIHHPNNLAKFNGDRVSARRADPEYEAAQEKYNTAVRDFQRYEAKTNEGVPTGPYVTKTQDWTDLGLKRALKEATDGNYDRLTWTPGAEQAKRYDLSKQIDMLQYDKDTGTIRAFKKSGTSFGEPVYGDPVIRQSGVSPEKLADIVGKEAADKLINSPTHISKSGTHILSGQDLSVGGEGMKSYYDKIVPTRLKEIVKRLDPSVNVEMSGIATGKKLDFGKGFDYEKPKSKNVEIPAMSIPITQKMKDAIKKGLPAFSVGGLGTGAALNYNLSPVDHDPFKDNSL